MIVYNFVQTTPDKALPLLWNGDYNSRFANSAWSPFADQVAVNVGLNARYSNINQFAEIPNCVVSNNVVLQPDLNSNNSLVTLTSIGGTRLTTTKEVESFRLTLSMPGLYKVDDKTGYMETAVSVGIFYRIHTEGDSPWRVIYSDYVISGKQRAEILKTIDAGNLVGRGITKPEKLDILLVRNTESHTGNMKIVDEVYIKELTEITYDSIAYNHTALLGVKIRATDQLSGQPPAVTSLVKGTKIAIPSNMLNVQRYDGQGNYNHTAVTAAYDSGWTDGKLTWDEATQTGTKVWTDNPVWCLYDLLTNKRYGLSNYYKISPDKIGLMQAQFYMLAKYCDEPIQYLDSTGASTVTKYRPRFSLNIVVDQTKSAAEWVSQICACMRASAFYSEGIMWIDIDRPKLPTQIFNMSNIKDFVQSGTSYRQIPNCLEVQYINPMQNYEIDVFRMESKELQDNPQLEERKKALVLIGVTNFDQAKALAKFTLLAGQHRNKVVTFKTGADAVRSMVTDVVGIQHDVPENGYGGKVQDVSGTTVTLSDPVEFSSTINYYLTVSDSVGVSTTVGITPAAYDTPCTTIVISAQPTYNTGEPYTIKVSDGYIIGVVTNSVELYRLVSVKRDTDNMCEITAVDYFADMYTSADNTGDYGIFSIPNYSLYTNPQRASVTGVTVAPRTFIDNAGNWKMGVDVFYEPPKNSSFWKGATLWYAKADTLDYNSVTENAKGVFSVTDIADAGLYKFVVTSNYISGKQTIEDALSDSISHPWRTEYVQTLVENNTFLEGVSGLCITNRANDGTFIGRNCIIEWRKPIVADAALNTTAGVTAGDASNNSWIKEYKVVVKDIGTDTIRRTTTVYVESFTYTHEMNHEDGNGVAVRTFKIDVAAVDRAGRTSVVKSIICDNPSPAQVN